MSFKFELNEDVKSCTLCNAVLNKDEECCFIIVKMIKYPTQSIELTIKVAHSACTTKAGYKLAGASGQIWTLGQVMTPSPSTK
jgi:hypothetical protein